ncbi:MAG: hypothetical protein IT380_15405 [Myxococcales bacterium]|nr:hypothetical protein [Myxococcales bacterium]
MNIDSTGPTLVVTATAPPNNTYGTNGSDFLPNDPDGTRWRLDESVAVRVTSSSLDVNEASVQLTARQAVGAGAPVTVGGGQACDAGAGQFCRDYQANLGSVPFPAFSGSVQFSATGEDAFGNTATSNAGSVAVTRWQWARRVDSTQFIRSAPLVGMGGRVFVATAGTTTGTLRAFNPDGTPVGGFASVTDGPIVGPMALGRAGSSTFVYYQPADNLGTLKAVSAADGMALGLTCPGGGGTPATNAGGVALFGTADAGAVSVGLQRGPSPSRGMALSSEAAACYPSASGGLSAIAAPANIVTTDSTVPAGAYFIGNDGALRRLDYTAASLSISSVSTVISGAGNFNGLALVSGTRLVGGGGGGPGVGRLFAFSLAPAGGGVTNAWPSGTNFDSPVTVPVASASQVFAIVRSSDAGVSNAAVASRLNIVDGIETARTAVLSAAGVTSSFSGNSVASPLLGQGGKLYVADEAGNLFVLPQTFASQSNAEWGAQLHPTVAGLVSASPTLDCNRRRPSSGKGVFYLATESGWLVSYLVDSATLDSSAPWPKYAGDLHNSGASNSAASVCP